MDNKITITDVSTAETTKKKELAGHDGYISSLKFVPGSGGTKFISASGDGEAWLWDTNSGKVITKFIGHLGDCGAASFPMTGAGNVFCTGSTDKTVRTWDVNSGKCQRTFVAPGEVNSICMCAMAPRPCTSHICAPHTCVSTSLRALETAGWPESSEPPPTRSHRRHSAGRTSPAIRPLRRYPNGAAVGYGTQNGHFGMFDIGSYTKLSEGKTGSKGAAVSLAFSLSGRMAYIGFEKGSMNVCDAFDFASYDGISGAHEGQVCGMALAPDGSGLATAGFDGLAKIWTGPA